MLVAQQQNGKRISLGERWEKAELENRRNSEVFFCPECGGKMLMKLGTKRVRHFAHQRGEGCPAEWENETDYHLNGKLKLYQWLIQSGLDAELEKYDPSSGQRADILIDWKGKKWALEFQCSPVSEELFKKRTDGYVESGITPIWIPGGKSLKRTSAKTVSLNSFEALFLRRNRMGWYIPSYCPEADVFILLTGILPVSERRMIAGFSAVPPNSMDPSYLIDPKPFHICSIFEWNREVHRFKRSLTAYNNRGKLSKFLNELYINRLNLHLLPTEVGLPLQSSLYIETPPVIWQSYLYIDLMRIFYEKGRVSRSAIYSTFLLRIRKGEIAIRQLPLEKESHFRFAVDDYLELLVQTDSLLKCSSDFFQPADSLLEQTSPDWESSAKKFYALHGSTILKFLNSSHFVNETFKRSVK
ncbi:competence protein CoiA [Mesobacillus zeae]|nr:competence protein CoiA family protein [Mesobacillus zeae]